MFGFLSELEERHSKLIFVSAGSVDGNNLDLTR